MTKRIVYTYFSDARIALMREAGEHPDLLFSLAEVQALGDKSWEDKLGCIAAYCYIVVDGAYTPADLDKLYDILIFELKKKRLVNVTTNTASIISTEGKVLTLDKLEEKKDEH